MYKTIRHLSSPAVVALCTVLLTLLGQTGFPFFGRAFAGASSSRPPVCDPVRVKKLFPQDKGFKLLLVPLSGVEDADAELGARATREMTTAFPVYVRKLIGKSKSVPWLTELSFASLSCTVSTHSDAHAVGRAAGADAVLWGRALCLQSEKNDGACRKLPLGFLDGPQDRVDHPGTELKVSLTLIHHELAAWGNGVQEANGLRTVDFPAQIGEQAYGVLNEVLGVYGFLAGQANDTLVDLHLARQTVTGGVRSLAEMDLLSAYFAAELGRFAVARSLLERAKTECGSIPDDCQTTALYVLALVESRDGSREQAVQLLTQAFGVSEQIKDPQKRLEFLSQLGGVHAYLHNYELALALFEKVRALQEAKADKVGLSQTLWQIAGFQHELGKNAEAFRTYEQVRKLFQQLGDSKSELTILATHTAFLLENRQLDAGEALLTEAEALAQKTGDTRGRGQVLYLKAQIYNLKQEPVAAIHAFKEAAELGKKAKDLLTEASSECGLGEIFETLEDHEQSIEHLEKALPLYTRLDSPKALAMVYGGLGWARFYLKQNDRALLNLEQARKYAKQIGDGAEERKDLSLLSQIYLDKPQDPLGQERMEEGLRLSKEAHDVEKTRGFLYTLGLHALKRDNLEAAVPYFQELQPLLSAAPQNDDLIGIYSIIALTLMDTGHFHDAVDSYRQAASAAHRGGHDQTAASILETAIGTALEGRDLAEAERLFAELHQYPVTPIVEATYQAQALSYRGAQEAAAAYKQVADLAEQLTDSEERRMFRTLAEGGLLRSQQPARWGHCPGAMILELRSPSQKTPLLLGDIVVEIQGQCAEGPATYERRLRQYTKLPKLTVKLWRNGRQLTLAAPPQQFAAGVRGF